MIFERDIEIAWPPRAVMVWLGGQLAREKLFGFT
jgi:hypothetical protein